MCQRPTTKISHNISATIAGLLRNTSKRDTGRQIAPWRRRIDRDGSAPRLVPNVVSEEVVEHVSTVVAAENVDGLLVSDHRVLGPAGANEFVELRHLPPPERGLTRPEVERQRVAIIGPARQAIRRFRGRSHCGKYLKEPTMMSKA